MGHGRRCQTHLLAPQAALHHGNQRKANNHAALRMESEAVSGEEKKEVCARWSRAPKPTYDATIRLIERSICPARPSHLSTPRLPAVPACFALPACCACLLCVPAVLARLPAWPGLPACLPACLPARPPVCLPPKTTLPRLPVDNGKRWHGPGRPRSRKACSVCMGHTNDGWAAKETCIVGRAPPDSGSRQCVLDVCVFSRQRGGDPSFDDAPRARS